MQSGPERSGPFCFAEPVPNADAQQFSDLRIAPHRRARDAIGLRTLPYRSDKERRRLAKRLAAVAIAMVMLQDVAIGQSLPVPPNQIMPRLPPVPQAQPRQRPAEPCRFSSADIPKGDIVPATRARQTPGGIALYGSENTTYGGRDTTDARTQRNAPCPTPPR
jgi:hypothetical protein